MKPKRGSLEIFNLSFLDIVSCGFGAVVLLVLLSKPAESPPQPDVEATAKYLRQVIEAKDNIAALTKDLLRKRQELATLQQSSATLDQAAASNKTQLGDRTAELEKLDGDLQGLSLVEASLKRASIRPSTSSVRDAEVGGIPVDSDYIIFIVDTSGSMREIWDRVSAQIINVLKIHPQVTGFQIMNDNGVHLISGYAGKWIPDTPARRKSVMNVFANWNSASNSSPVEGLEVALKRYARPGRSLSIYIFGDDYTGSSYDPVIDALSKLNTNKVTGKPLAKVHAIGFLSNYSTNRFPILMREVTHRNGGTFIALSR